MGDDREDVYERDSSFAFSKLLSSMQGLSLNLLQLPSKQSWIFVHRQGLSGDQNGPVPACEEQTQAGK